MKAGKPERHSDRIKNLVDNVYNGPGHSDIQLRRAVKQKVADHCGRFSANDLRLPEVLEAYVDKIALHAYKVTDADVDALRADGFSEDSIFELTISAALSAGIARLRCGMAALTGGEDAS